MIIEREGSQYPPRTGGVLSPDFFDHKTIKNEAKEAQVKTNIAPTRWSEGYLFDENEPVIAIPMAHTNTKNVPILRILGCESFSICQKCIPIRIINILEIIAPIVKK